MRIPFPERIPLIGAILFATSLFIVQMLEGTALYFGVGCFIFIILATFAFNVAGGLTRASGAYVFFYTLLVVLIGLCYKAFLGEPANSNLLDPKRDIEVYIGGMAGMYVAALLSRRLRRKVGLLQPLLKESEMYRAAVGCIAAGIVFPILLTFLGSASAQLRTTFAQLNALCSLGVLIGVVGEIRKSGGRSSVNVAILIGASWLFLGGLAGFSKEGLITPFFCWLVAVAAMHYRVSAMQIAACILFTFVVFYYLNPLSEYGRDLPTLKSTFTDRLAIAFDLLEHANRTRRIYKEGERNAPVNPLGEFYNKPQGFWDRLQFISVDDALVNYTDSGSTVGLLPLKFELFNSVPHFLWPNKPSFNFGMYYVHLITHAPTDRGDLTTGISFSPTSEAFIIARWWGVLLIAPLLWFLFFVVSDSLFGDTRATPWGLLALALIAHGAPEGALRGVIHFIAFGSEILTFCALFATYVAPLISFAVIGRGPTLIHNRRTWREVSQ